MSRTWQHEWTRFEYKQPLKIDPLDVCRYYIILRHYYKTILLQEHFSVVCRGRSGGFGECKRILRHYSNAELEPKCDFLSAMTVFLCYLNLTRLVVVWRENISWILISLPKIYLKLYFCWFCVELKRCFAKFFLGVARFL